MKNKSSRKRNANRLKKHMSIKGARVVISGKGKTLKKEGYLEDK